MKKSLVKQQLEDKAEAFWLAINEIADYQFEHVVRPWLVKKGYTFTSGMGTWVVHAPHTGRRLERSEIPARILEVLEIDVPLYDHELGSIMPEYPDD